MTLGSASLTAAVLSLACVACSDILDLQPALTAAPSCTEDAECRSGEICQYLQCVSATCQLSQLRCNGLDAERCSNDGAWTIAEHCTAACAMGACVTPPSCGAKSQTCAGVSCCSASVVDGGKFDLRYRYATGDDATESEQVPRTVRSFILDRFEVTWSRFLELAEAYDDREKTRPKDGAGAHPAFPSSGWKAAWAESLALVPDSRRGLQNVLDRARRPSPAESGDLPVRGINWYLAFAFCIWDGGRLPTEAEWAYAAVGGNDGQRIYPWTPRDRSASILAEDALFSDGETLEDVGPVGTHPSGEGEFGQDDLAGNVAEWVADVYQERLEPDCADDGALRLDEHECLQREGGALRVQRGGSYRDNAEGLRNDARSYGLTDRSDQPIGFRCARDMPSPAFTTSNEGD